MLKLRAKWEGKCIRHPGYNPEKQGVAGIKAGCDTCGELLSAWNLFTDFLVFLAEREKKIYILGGRVSFGVPVKYVATKAAK